MKLERGAVIKMEQKKTWNEQTTTEKLGYYVAPDLYNQLMKAKDKVVKGNQDRVYVVDGREGVGKSTLALQLAYVVDPTFSLDNVVFTAEDFEKKIRTLGKYKAIIYDESFNGLSSKGALSKGNKKLVTLLMECRQLGLFIFIVLPSIFLLEKYVGIFRSQGLIHCYASRKGTNRRYYCLYNYANKKILYLLGRTLMDYGKPRIHKSYRFYSKFPPTISAKDYNKKKLKVFREDKVVENKIEARYRSERDYAIYILNQKFKMTQIDIAKAFKNAKIHLTQSSISRIIDNVPENMHYEI